MTIPAIRVERLGKRYSPEPVRTADTAAVPTLRESVHRRCRPRSPVGCGAPR